MKIRIKIKKEIDSSSCLKHTIKFNEKNYIFLGTLGPYINSKKDRLKNIKFDMNEMYVDRN